MNLIVIETLKGLGVIFGVAILLTILIQGTTLLYGWLGDSIGLIPLFPAVTFLAYLVGQAISAPRKRKA